MNFCCYIFFICIFNFSFLINPFTSKSYAEDVNSNWNMVLTRVKLLKKWQFFFDVQPRFDLEDSKAHGSSGVRQLLIRPAIGYHWSDSFQSYIGYTLVENYNPHVTEHDIFQDTNFKSSYKDLTFLQRLRTEQRILEKEGEVAHRWRFLSSISIPTNLLNNTSFVISDEIFLNLNNVNSAVQSGLTENRAFVGLSMSLKKNIQTIFGYQHQYREGRNGRDDNVNHIALFSLIMDYDWKDL